MLVVAEPGDPHPGESHPADPVAALESAFLYAYQCFGNGKDQFHRNVRTILDLCWPGEGFDSQMRKTWITESVQCSAQKEGGSVRAPVGAMCRSRYLDEQLRLFPSAVVAALGSKAAKRLAGRDFIPAFAAAPPGCNFAGAQNRGRLLRKRFWRGLEHDEASHDRDHDWPCADARILFAQQSAAARGQVAGDGRRAIDCRVPRRRERVVRGHREVTYEVRGDDVIVHSESGMGKGMAVRYTMTGPDSATAEFGTLRRIQ